MKEHIPFPRFPTEYEEYLFWRKIIITKPTECWWWISDADNGFYGKHTYTGTGFYAHRVAWYFTHHNDPSELVVDHLCNYTFCCNPAHLEPKTDLENTLRVIEQHGRSFREECARGHSLLTEENYYQISPGHRLCKICEDERRLLVINFQDLPTEVCRYGHLYDEANTAWHGGRRYCKVCIQRINKDRQEQKNEWRRKKKAELRKKKAGEQQ